jgi:hypothetical protein
MFLWGSLFKRLLNFELLDTAQFLWFRGQINLLKIVIQKSRLCVQNHSPLCDTPKGLTIR